MRKTDFGTNRINVISYSPILDSVAQTDFCVNELRRVFHGRGHCFPCLEYINLDFYPPFLFLTSYQNIETIELQRLADQIWDSASVHSDFVKGLVYQQRAGRNTSSQVLYGVLPDPHIVIEQGLSYQVDLLKHQNTGIFPDMRNGRSFVASQSRNKKVLNLFSYTCGFSLAAMQGGAASVVNMDMNKGVLTQGKMNHKLNGFDQNVRFFPHDILKSFGKIKKMGPFELIIIDPPSFQKGSFELTKDYQKILRRLPEVVSNNAILLLCANSPDLSEKDFIGLISEHAGDEFSFEYRLENLPDFPEKDQDKNLKALVYRYRV